MIRLFATLGVVAAIPVLFNSDAAKQFDACEMQAIEKMGYQQGDWHSPAGRYLYA
ncbi:hypothetical protein [Bradyrhizobium sp. HKCCYLS20291]|uniref:hypothetical protein n=1 Tax=Bradyrhizobium sp. HKCCYLS20291 TaxID=3420766 RepID=UPI003EBE5842